MASGKSTHHAGQAASSGERPSGQWMWLAALGIAVLYMGSTLLTPLYPIYQREFGFSELVVTGIYAIYVVGNLVVLFLFGRLSDQIGRRRTTLMALACTVLSVLCFAFAMNAAWLFPARVLSGLGAGLGAGALTAWIAELEPNQDRARAAMVASAANLAGLALGALMAGLLATHVPWPLRSSYAVYLCLLLPLIAVVRSAPETVDEPARSFGALSLRPRLGIPRDIRWAFVAPAAMAFAAFSLGGFYAALLPGLLAQGLHQSDPAVIGGVVAAFFATAAVTAGATTSLGGRSSMLIALGLLWLGLALLLSAEAWRSMAWLLIATLVAGAAMALGYRGSLQIVNQIAPPEHRAEIVSSYLLVCFSANSLPVIGVGLLSVPMGAPHAHRVFALALVILASGACAVTWRHAEPVRGTADRP
jgi:MFS family permease